ncbi:unnamed protein product [Ceratitis capitata]|nr:unnamed protein product [Ceratitis capitata]
MNASFQSFEKVRKAAELFEMHHNCKLSTRDSSKIKVEQLNIKNSKLMYNYILYTCARNGSKRCREVGTGDIKKKITRQRESKKIGCPVKIKLERKLDKEKQIEVLHVTKLTVKHNHEPNDLSEDELSDMEENQHNSNNMTDSKLLALRKALQKIETFARQKNDDELERIENIVTKLHEHLTNDLDVTFLQKVNVSLEAGNYSVHFEQPIDQENSISIIEDFSEIQTVKTPCQKRGRGRPRGSKKAQL